MRTSYDFAPLFRSTVGFDRLLDLMETNTRPEWPPYNIEKVGDDQYRISMAIAGFAPSEVELTQQHNTLFVSGHKDAEQGQREMLHQGLAFRSFKQTFKLADHVKVTSANLENGLLTIELAREIPEQLKPRRIDVGATQSSRPKLVEQSVKAA